MALSLKLIPRPETPVIPLHIARWHCGALQILFPSPICALALLFHQPQIQLAVILEGFHCESSTSLASGMSHTHTHLHMHAHNTAKPSRQNTDEHIHFIIPSSAGDSWPLSTWPDWDETSIDLEMLKQTERKTEMFIGLLFSASSNTLRCGLILRQYSTREDTAAHSVLQIFIRHCALW